MTNDGQSRQTVLPRLRAVALVLMKARGGRAVLQLTGQLVSEKVNF